MEPLTHALESMADEIETGGTADGELFVLGKVTPFDIDDDGDLLHDFFDDWQLRERVTLEVDELVSCYKEPRGGMFTYNYTLSAVTLPSRRRLYLEWGDMVDSATRHPGSTPSPTNNSTRSPRCRCPSPTATPRSTTNSRPGNGPPPTCSTTSTTP